MEPRHPPVAQPCSRAPVACLAICQCDAGLEQWAADVSAACLWLYFFWNAFGQQLANKITAHPGLAHLDLPPAFQITYPTLLKAATGQCAYFHSNSSPAQHSQIGHPLPSPAKQTKTRKKTLLITQPPPAEFFYDDVHPACGPRSSRWGLKCSNKCSDVTYPPCHHSCDTQQKPCVMLTVSSINPAWDHFK